MEECKCSECNFAYGVKGADITSPHVICGVLSKKYNMTIIVPAKTDACGSFLLCE